MHIFKRVVTVILFIVVLSITIVTFIDYLSVKNDKDPKFCYDMKEYDKGIEHIKECKGLVYKYYVIEGDRTLTKRFVPIWITLDE